ncbi:hypothetical protein LTR37_005131 [Vermiconidia calcicola]|uniref:Uncharacterized protein n=1 Tax=Vermiconidia calcicola TaxID=1690605 RepID=A0ACC3NL85_9PEZI|nr:hypothetical protein LTR37_005131 [Vermiconidia calcicola]
MPKPCTSLDERAPPPTTVRLEASLTEHPYDLQEYLEQHESKRKTVLYLAYGSNLCNETFRGKRGIKPLSQVNVQVPSLRLTFDLPGLPYAEPCFANTGRRDPENDPSAQRRDTAIDGEKTPLLAPSIRKSQYRKDQWHKGLVGVVYEVTPEDYAHIIQTEGGGASYHDIMVDCHAFPLDNPEAPVPQNPTLPPFKAHTLFAPASAPGDPPPKDGGRFQRPDTSYAQPSARYLKLMTDGAGETGLPYEYQHYLHSLRPYTMTTARQRVGQFVFMAIWAPFITLVFALGKMFADDKGRTPRWLRAFMGALFKAVWVSYDVFFKPIFGNGERTTTDTDEKDEQGPRTLAPRVPVGELKDMIPLVQEKSRTADQCV